MIVYLNNLPIHIFPLNLSFSFLALHLNPSIWKEAENRFTALSRKREWLIGRYYLQLLCPTYQTLHYSPNGKPLLDQNSHLSITHSSTHLALAFHKKNIGIDLASYSTKISSIISRVFSSQEVEYIISHKFPNKIALLFWSAKESVYKYCDISGLQFKQQIQIILPNYLQSPLKIKVCHANQCYHLKVYFVFLGNQVLTLCMPDEKQNNF